MERGGTGSLAEFSWTADMREPLKMQQVLQTRDLRSSQCFEEILPE